MSTPSERMARLDDYERGAADLDADAFEADLFERALAGEAPELVFRDALGAGVRAMAARGTLDTFITAREAAALRARPDLRVLYQDAGVDLRWRAGTDDADVVITRIPLDLTGVARLDVELGLQGGPVLKTLADATFDREDGAVYFCCEADLARRIQGRPFGRFFAIEEGRRRLLADVTIASEG